MTSDNGFEAFRLLAEQRRSIRRFLRNPVSRDVLEEILTVARHAPSGANLQPGKIHVLSGKPLALLSHDVSTAFLSGDKGAEDYSYFPDPLPKELRQRQVDTGWALYGSLGIGRRDVAARREQHNRNFLFFEAPVGLIVSIDRAMGKGCYMDMGMFLQNLFLAINARGLACCGIGALAPYHQIVRRHLGLSIDQVVVCGIALGYADASAAENQFKTGRASLDEYADFRFFESD